MEQRILLIEDNPDITRVVQYELEQAGYRVVTWQGMPPDRFLDDVAYLDGRLLADAPMGELDWEPERMDAAFPPRLERRFSATITCSEISRRRARRRV